MSISLWKVLNFRRDQHSTSPRGFCWQWFPSPHPQLPSATVQLWRWAEETNSFTATTSPRPRDTEHWQRQSHQQENTKAWGSASLKLRSYAGQARHQPTSWDLTGSSGRWENDSALDRLSRDIPGWAEILRMHRRHQSGLGPPTHSLTTNLHLYTQWDARGFCWQ